MNWLDELLGNKEQEQFPEFSPMMQEPVDINQKDMPQSTMEKAPVSPMDLIPSQENKPEQKAFNESIGKPEQPEMNPMVKDHLMKNVIPNKYSAENREALVNEDSGPNPWAMGLAGLGGALQDYGLGGKGSAMQNVMNMQKMAKDKRDGKLKDFDVMADKEKTARYDDPTSEESKQAQELALKFGLSPEKASALSANRLNELIPSLSKLMDIENQKQNRTEARDERRFQAGIKMDEKKSKEADELYTPYGQARTKQGAKDLNAAYDAKRDFNARLQDMIDLRKNVGAEVWDREAVARGKQLSKDLLLKYKDMAKLGVLSQADEKILNAIIPADPTEFSFSSFVGQDPILTKLEEFKQDSEDDFNRKVQTRIKDSSNADVQIKPSQKPTAKTVMQNGIEYILNEETGEYE